MKQPNRAQLRTKRRAAQTAELHRRIAADGHRDGYRQGMLDALEPWRTRRSGRPFPLGDQLDPVSAIENTAQAMALSSLRIRTDVERDAFRDGYTVRLSHTRIDGQRFCTAEVISSHMIRDADSTYDLIGRVLQHNAHNLVGAVMRGQS
jgi:hypothetical protein